MKTLSGKFGVWALAGAGAVLSGCSTTPWQRDCVRWWGGDIAQEQRNQQNCALGSNHWDRSGTAPAGSGGSGSSITRISTPQGSYLVNSQGSTITVIQTSKGR